MHTGYEFNTDWFIDQVKRNKLYPPSQSEVGRLDRLDAFRESFRRTIKRIQAEVAQ